MRTHVVGSVVALCVVVATANAQRTPEGGAATLRVARVTPEATASPGDVITIAFDRPVAGSLEHAVDVRSVVRLTPSIAARIEWRDPATIRVVPEAPLVPGTSLHVTIDTTLTAIDGARLAHRFERTIEILGARRLHAHPALHAGGEAILPPDGRITLVYSASIDTSALNATTRVEFSGGGQCGAAASIPFTIKAERPVESNDPYDIQQAGGWGRDTLGDRFRRVVELAPTAKLPEGCAGRFLIASLDSADHPVIAYRIRTPPPFRVTSVGCYDGLEDRTRDCAEYPELAVSFSVAVARDQVVRHVHVNGADSSVVAAFMLRGTRWVLNEIVPPRARVGVVIDSALTDTYGRTLGADFRTVVGGGDRRAQASIGAGLTVIAGSAIPSVTVRHVNVDSVSLRITDVENRARTGIIVSQGNVADRNVRNGGFERRVTMALPASFNQEGVTNLPLPSLPGPQGRMYAVRLERWYPSAVPDGAGRRATSVPSGQRAGDRVPLFLVATDLAVHAKLSDDGGYALVTLVGSTAPVARARVVVEAQSGRVIARGTTDASGVARLVQTDEEDPNDAWPKEMVLVPLAQRAHGVRVVWAEAEGRTTFAYAPDRFSGDEVEPSSIGVSFREGYDPSSPRIEALTYTERGIYRPGEMVYLGAIAREGTLGRPAPLPAGDSARWRVTRYDPTDGGEVVVHDAIVALRRFGVANDSFRLGRTARLGQYSATLAVHRGERWRRVGSTSFSVSEYRVPEFAIDLALDSTRRWLGDSVQVEVAARYLFGAPMPGASIDWSVDQEELRPWQVDIPGLDGRWSVGDGWRWWEREESQRWEARGHDSLDAAGRLRRSLPTSDSAFTRPARLTATFAVTDLNRQVIVRSASSIVHATAFYLALRVEDASWWWTTGRRTRVHLLAVRPSGEHVAGTSVEWLLVRRRWTFVPSAQRWEALSDTVQRGQATSADSAIAIDFVPSGAGELSLVVRATDERRRPVSASVTRWLSGDAGWSRGRRSPLHLPLITSSGRARVGDVVTVRFSSPFDSADAWMTVEREGVLEQRVYRVGRGDDSVRVPIIATHVPNIFVGIVLVRRGAPALVDSAAQRLRAGYAIVEVDSSSKALDVRVSALGTSFAPGDSVTLEVRVRNRAGPGSASVVTVWGVDEGVLSLTDYETPDPLATLYGRVALGTSFLSSLVRLDRRAGPSLHRIRSRGMALLDAPLHVDAVVTTGAGTADALNFSTKGVAIQLRSRFVTTPFFRTVEVNAGGVARMRVRLPDNVTTFRLVAVAASDDAYGSADTALVVNKPLIVRAALPRIVRTDDELQAGGVVNRLDASAAAVSVRAGGRGMVLAGDSTLSIDVASAGREARFSWRVAATDSVAVRLTASDDRHGDAVQHSLVVAPSFHPRTFVTSGIVRDTAMVRLALPREVDPARSRLTLRVGATPLTLLREAADYLRTYPYECTEQLVSRGRVLLAQLQLSRAGFDVSIARGEAQRALEDVIATITGRQGVLGGFGYWSAESWTNPWLTAHVVEFLLDANALGLEVPSFVLKGATRYVSSEYEVDPKGRLDSIDVYGTRAERDLEVRRRVGQRIATLMLLRRLGAPKPDAELALWPFRERMAWEDLVRFARLLSAAGRRDEGRTMLLLAWDATSRAGRRLDIPVDAASPAGFPSTVRPMTELLHATQAVAPEHPDLGLLVESIVQRDRSTAGYWWNTQDHASAAAAIAAIGSLVPVKKGARVSLFSALAPARRRVGTVDGVPRGVREASWSLSDLTLAEGDSIVVPIVLETRDRIAAFWSVSVEEVPRERPVSPESRGIVVERWYERFDDGRTVTELKEGDLVRIRVRVTVPNTRDFVAIEDPLPSGLEAVDLSLRTSASLGPFSTAASEAIEAARRRDAGGGSAWTAFGGRWECGWWTPWEHREIRDDGVRWFARTLWRGVYSVSYVARATTSGRFVRPPAYAEEMYNPALSGRSDGGWFRVSTKSP